MDGRRPARAVRVLGGALNGGSLANNQMLYVATGPFGFP
jgi:hypothetical protein